MHPQPTQPAALRLTCKIAVGAYLTNGVFCELGLVRLWDNNYASLLHVKTMVSTIYATLALSASNLSAPCTAAARTAKRHSPTRELVSAPSPSRCRPAWPRSAAGKSLVLFDRPRSRSVVGTAPAAVVRELRAFAAWPRRRGMWDMGACRPMVGAARVDACATRRKGSVRVSFPPQHHCAYSCEAGPNVSRNGVASYNLNALFGARAIFCWLQSTQQRSHTNQLPPRLK